MDSILRMIDLIVPTDKNIVLIKIKKILLFKFAALIREENLALKKKIKNHRTELI
jgi:hypothetical protein